MISRSTKYLTKFQSFIGVTWTDSVLNFVRNLSYIEIRSFSLIYECSTMECKSINLKLLANELLFNGKRITILWHGRQRSRELTQICVTAVLNRWRATT